jgi:hypothetical protein
MKLNATVLNPGPLTNRRRLKMDNPVKIAEGYYRYPEILHPTDGVVLELIIDHINGAALDTYVAISGRFAICGKDRAEFSEKLGELIDKYRI